MTTAVTGVTAVTAVTRCLSGRWNPDVLRPVECRGARVYGHTDHGSSHGTVRVASFGPYGVSYL